MKTTPCTVGAKLSAYAFSSAPRCGSKTRQGNPCQSPAIRGKERCRMHGGKGSGAPRGNQNALKHGFMTHKFKEQRRQIKQILMKCGASLKDITDKATLGH